MQGALGYVSLDVQVSTSLWVLNKTGLYWVQVSLAPDRPHRVWCADLIKPSLYPPLSRHRMHLLQLLGQVLLQHSACIWIRLAQSLANGTGFSTLKNQNYSSSKENMIVHCKKYAIFCHIISLFLPNLINLATYFGATVPHNFTGPALFVCYIDSTKSFRKTNLLLAAFKPAPPWNTHVSGMEFSYIHVLKTLLVTSLGNH